MACEDPQGVPSQNLPLVPAIGQKKVLACVDSWAKIPQKSENTNLLAVDKNWWVVFLLSTDFSRISYPFNFGLIMDKKGFLESFFIRNPWQLITHFNEWKATVEKSSDHSTWYNLCSLYNLWWKNKVFRYKGVRNTSFLSL